VSKADTARAKAARLAEGRRRNGATEAQPEPAAHAGPETVQESLDVSTAPEPSKIPETSSATRSKPLAGIPARGPVRTKDVRVSLDLKPALYDELGEWNRSAARALGRGRVTNADTLRALVRRLVSDPDLSTEVLEALRRDASS
jgi:hypothetical protein